MTVQVYGAHQAGRRLVTQGWESNQLIPSGMRLKIRLGPEVTTTKPGQADSKGYATLDIEPPIITPKDIFNCDMIEVSPA